MSLINLATRRQRSASAISGTAIATVLAWCVFGFLFAVIWRSAVTLF